MKTLAFFIASILATGLIGNAYAHTSEIIGDYKIEIGWMNEPPIAGIDNAIELVVTIATEFEKEQAKSHSEHEEEHMESEHEEEHMESEGISGLSDIIKAEVTLGEVTTTLMFHESEFAGVYHAEFMPRVTGFPIVHISGTIVETEIDLDMHPEEIEPLSTLAPLHQIEHGIDAADVECKEGLDLYMKTFDESAVCVSSTTADVLVKRGWLSLF